MLKRYVFDLKRATHTCTSERMYAPICILCFYKQSLCTGFSRSVRSFQTISTALHFIGFTFA